MLTIEDLKEYGAEVESGLARCMNAESFYLRLVHTAVEDSKIDELEKYIISGELEKAFETAHAMKGMYANLSLTPLLEPVSKMTELLRSRTQTDYSALMTEAKAQFRKLAELCSQSSF